MSDELVNTLLFEEAIAEQAMADALFASLTTSEPLVHALIDTGAITNAALSRFLARGSAPELLRVQPATDLVDRLPRGLPARLFAIPVRRDAVTGTVDIAVADMGDPHPGNEIAFHLSAPVRLVRAPLEVIEDALSRMQGRRQPLAAPHDTLLLEHEHGQPHDEPPRRRMDTPSWGTPVHSTNVEVNLRAPPHDLDSEIPIPLVRRTSAADGTEHGERLPDPNAWLVARIPPPPATPSNTGAYTTHVAGSARTRGRRASQSDALPAATRSDVLTMLRSATSRHTIFDLVLEGTRSLSPRAAIFVARRGGYRGWSCTPLFGDRGALTELFVNANAPSIFDEVARSGLYVGPVRDDTVHAPLLDVMGGSSRDVTVVAVRIRGRATVMIAADDVGNAKVAARKLDKLAKAAGNALVRVLRTRKQAAHR